MMRVGYSNIRTPDWNTGRAATTSRHFHAHKMKSHGAYRGPNGRSVVRGAPRTAAYPSIAATCSVATASEKMPVNETIAIAAMASSVDPPAVGVL